MIDVTFRPVDQWPGELRFGHRSSPFRAPWGKTLQLLDRELHHLSARNPVIMLALEESDIRLDGWPRARATARHPGVVLAFDSRYGPLKYASAEFTRWEDNLRAIALGLEALRKVDRYGITRRGEQYTGWKALPAGGESIASRDEAQRFIDQHGGSYREAVKRLHPDAGGDPADFRRLQAARQLLEGAPA